MTFSPSALSRLKLLPGKPVSQFDGLRLRSTARPTGTPLSVLRKASEAAAFELRGFKFGGVK